MSSAVGGGYMEKASFNKDAFTPDGFQLHAVQIRAIV